MSCQFRSLITSLIFRFLARALLIMCSTYIDRKKIIIRDSLKSFASTIVENTSRLLIFL